MVLKEAFREQNFLDGLIESAIGFLRRTDNVVNKTQKHMRKASNPDAEDEEIKVPKNVEVDYTPNAVVSFIMNVVDEKEKLTKAIVEAKLKSDIDIDSSIAMNKTKQKVATVLKNMSDIKGGEVKKKSMAQKFDINGCPVNYSYDMTEITTIDFDRNLVKSLSKKLTKESDNVSTKIDKVNVDLEVDYSPVYEIGDSLDDCIEVFLSLKK